MRRTAFAAFMALFVSSPAWAAVLVSQQPVNGGGISRSSQLWQDPGPGGNNLDGDAICWEDFTLAAPASINHMEWWGTGASELGFRIEFWRQDPGTVAYQPLAVFDQDPGPGTVTPEARFTVTPADFTASPGPGGITHFSLDLASRVDLPANDPSNPRWFVGIIGLTHQAYVPFNWSQGTGGSNRTFQFVRGDGSIFRSLGEGRALVLAAVPEPACAALVGAAVVPVMLCRPRRRPGGS